MKILVSENQFKFLVNLITENDDRVKENVMFVGDSLSAGKGATWNYLLEKSHPEWNVTHVVEGGKRTDWMLNNMLPKLKEKKYDKVFIYGGTNDAFSIGISLSSAVSNIQKMVDAVNKQGGQAYVFLGYEAGSVMVDKHLKPTTYKGKIICDIPCMKKARERMIHLQKDLSSQISGAIIIPTISGDDTWAPGDGTHVGPGPHRKMKDHVSKYITDNKKTTSSDTKNDNNLDNDVSRKFFYDYFDFLKLKKVVNKESDEKDIKRLQIILAMATGEKLDLNGKLDTKTEDLLKKYQKDNNLTVTGNFDIETQEVLTKKIFPNYVTSKPSTQSKETTTNDNTNFSVITNSGVKIRTLPSDLEQKFKNIPGVNYEKFKNDIEAVGIPVKYAIRQLYIESAFSPDVISCKRKSTSGAMGLAQFMPKTWPEYGKGGDPCNVQDALPAYVRLMAFLAKKFPGRLDLAIASYNSGPYVQYPAKSGKYVYDNALKNKTPFTELKGKIPAEAYGYASSILQP